MRTTTQNRELRLVSEDGQAIVEFAIVLPILGLLLGGILQFGVAFHNYLGITDAARVGARAAAVHRTTGACAAAKTAIQNTVSEKQWDVIKGRITCSPPGNPGDPLNVGDQFKISIEYPYDIGVAPVDKTGNLLAEATERLE
jgi:Flp pilus assembly protein TadG